MEPNRALLPKERRILREGIEQLSSAQLGRLIRSKVPLTRDASIYDPETGAG